MPHRLNRSGMNSLSVLGATLLVSAFLVSSVLGLLAYWTPLPLYDSTSIVRFLASEPTAIDTLRYLLEEHNEHRIVFTKTLLLLDFSVTHGTKIVPTLLLLGINAGILLGVFRVFRPVLTSFPQQILSVATLGVLCFSLVQARNFDSIFQLQFFLVNLFALLSFTWISQWMTSNSAVGTPASLSGSHSGHLLLALFAAALAAFNMANGLFVIVILALAMIMSKKWRVAVIAVLWAILCWLLYFRGYTAPPGSNESSIQWQQAWMILPFLIFFLGNIFNAGLPQTLDVLLFGTAGLALSAAFGCYLVRHRRSLTPADRVTGMVLAFVLMGVGAASLQRLGRGNMELALVGRYSTLCVLFWAVMLSWLTQWVYSAPARFRHVALALFLTLATATLGWRQAGLFQQMRSEGSLRKRANVALGVDFTHLDIVQDALPAYERDTLEYLWKQRASVFHSPEFEQLGTRIELHPSVPPSIQLIPRSLCFKGHAFAPQLMLQMEGMWMDAPSSAAGTYTIVTPTGDIVGAALLHPSLAPPPTASEWRTRSTNEGMQWHAFITRGAGLETDSWYLLKSERGRSKTEPLFEIRYDGHPTIPIRPVFDLGSFHPIAGCKVLSMRGKWMRYGYFDALNPVHPSEEIWGTWSPQLGDANTGSMHICVDKVDALASNERVVLPILVGPTSGACELTVRTPDAAEHAGWPLETGEMIVDGWTFYDITEFVTAQDLVFAIADRGDQWGQRVAFSMPVILRIN